MARTSRDPGPVLAGTSDPAAVRLRPGQAAARLSLVLGLLLGPLAWCAVDPAAKGPDPGESVAGDPGEDWRNGPVQYLLTPEEHERYGRLRTEEARRAFVSRFWKRLDPDPEDPGNTFKDRFDRLCALADEKFSTPYVKGWRTDRGRVVIVLGEPDSVRPAAGDPVSVVREVWTYNRRPGGRPEPIEIVFYGDRQGQFRLQPRPGFETETFRDAVDAWREILRLRAQLQLPTWDLVPRDLARIYEQLRPSIWAGSTARSRVGRDRLAAGRSAKSHGGDAEGSGAPTASPIVSDAAYFFQATDGAIVVVLVLEYRAEPAAGPPSAPEAGVPAEPLAAAWILGDASRMAGRPSAEVAVRLERRVDLDRAGVAVFTGRAYLEPGTYEVRYAVEERSQRSLAIRNVSLTVPDIPVGELAASTIVPAEWFGPAHEGEHSPFAMGSEEVIPKPGASFRRGEPVKIYFQVYGAARDPASRKPRMDVTFRFEKAGSRKFKRHGRPAAIYGAAGESMGLTLAVDDWPRGQYRVEVDLVDRVSGAETSTEGYFRIAD